MEKTILVIEDNEQNMYMMTYLLESSHYQVLQSSTGADGIKMAMDLNPDGILLDIQLPEMDGYAVLRKIRTIARLKMTPVIVVTSYAMAGDSIKSYEAGANGYIEKPIDPDSFISTMEAFFKNL